MQTASKKVINGWAMYDWANSVYNLVITSTIFPAYFESVTGGGNDATSNDTVHLFGRTFVNTSLYNYALGIAFLLVAVMSPLLSSIADYKGNKKKFLFFFCTMGSIACSAMYFFDASNLGYGLLCLIVACVGFWSSLVFYNSYLPEIAAPEDQDRVSAKGFAYGYIGSVLLQIICFVFVLKPELFGITDASLPARLSFLLVGIWWIGFAQIPFRKLPAGSPNYDKITKSTVKNGFQELLKVWNQLKSMALLKRFLFAFFFYSMGVQTIMLVAAGFGEKVLKLGTSKLIAIILIIQLVAIIGALIMSFFAKRYGNIQVIIVVLTIWIGVCVAAYYIQNETQFYVIAAVVGLVMGGIQSISRSTYSKF
ncbi:MAG: MFS transporter, partial [Sphingobacteriales bacterium 24-40-4]